MALVPIDSPLRRVPKSVDRRVVLFLDGIRYSIECYELAWTRLERSLDTLSHLADDAKDFTPLIVAATSDAWTMVDSANRLLTLLDQAPKLKKKEPELQLFRRRTEVIEDLRNFFQHLGSEIASFSKRKKPLLGTIKWVTAQGDPNDRNLHMIVPGTFYDQLQTTGIIFDRREGRFIQRIVLEAGQSEIDLADLNSLVERFVNWYTDWFNRTFTGDERYDSDVRMRIIIQPRPKTAPPEKADGSAEGQPPETGAAPGVPAAPTEGG
jgi:hypothetical protein